MKKTVLKSFGVLFLMMSAIGCSDSGSDVEMHEKAFSTKSKYTATYRAMMEESLDKSLSEFENYVDVVDDKLVFNESQYKKDISVGFGENYFADLKIDQNKITDDISKPFPSDIDWGSTHYTANQVNYMQKFYENIINLQDDSKLQSVLDTYANEVDSDQNLSDDEKIELLLLREYVDVLIDYNSIGKFDKIYDVLDAKQNQIKKGRCQVSGRNLAIGAVIGFASGAVTGAKAGAVAGTFTVPGLGTATGAVGGAVFGGFAGFIGGAISSVAHDLLSTCFR